MPRPTRCPAALQPRARKSFHAPSSAQIPNPALLFRIIVAKVASMRRIRIWCSGGWLAVVVPLGQVFAQIDPIPRDILHAGYESP